MKRIAGMLAAAALAAALARADEVVLANGDRLSGEVVRLTGEELTLRTTYAGEVRIDRAAVAVVRVKEDVEVLLEDEAGLTALRGELPLPRIAFVNPTPEQSGVGVAYKGRVAFSSTHVRGNSTSGAMVSDASFEARARAYRWSLVLSAAQASEAGQRTASGLLGRASFDRFVAPKRFWYVRASGERDRFAGIERRGTAGTGYGVQFRESDRITLDLRGGPELVSTRSVDGATESHPALGWGLRYAHKVFDRRAELFHEHDGFWSLQRSQDVTLRSRSGVRLPLAAGLSASAQLNVDWENMPEPGREATDTTLLLGLGYEW